MENISNERLLQGARNLKAKGYSPEQVNAWLQTKGSSLEAMKSYASNQRQIKTPIVQQSQANTLSERDKWLGRATALDSGATLGFGKKLGGVINAIGASPVDVVLGGKNWLQAFNDRYNEIVKDANNARKAYAEEHPIENIAEELSGSFIGAPQKLLISGVKQAKNLVIGKIAQELAKLFAVGTVGSGTSVVSNANAQDSIADYINQEKAANDAASGFLWNTIPLVGFKGVGLLGNVATKATPKVLGMTTGAGGKSISKAFESGKTGNETFLKNMRGEVGADEVVDKVFSELDKIKAIRSKNYDFDMNFIRHNPTKLNLQPVIDRVKNIIRTEGGGSDYLVDKETSRFLDETKEVLNRFYKDKPRHNIAGFDDLKKRINNIKTSPDSNAARVQKNVVDSIKAEIMKQDKGYKGVMDNYGRDSEIIEELKRTFSIDKRANPETTLRKLQSVTRNNANTNFNYRDILLQMLDKDGEVSNAIAGQALNSWTPRGLIGGGGALLSGLSPKTLLFSPRIVGETAYKLGNQATKRANQIKAIENLFKKPINLGAINKKKE